ncbi:hypothetical protein FXO37_31474 [Capsicum annuum]|nr:hypothetical protein FXO37_31474 [Capsicum annuum]
MGIQNVKELGISGYWIESGHYGALDSYLMHLQVFLASAKVFPATLKKLKLERTLISWSYLDIIAELPNLEVLKLMGGACSGKEWYPNVRGFTRLKVLLIEDYLLEYWKAIDDNFPVLERLVLKQCRYLKEIPIEFAEIPTLQLIELTSCLPELAESAARIQQEQEELGNNPVDVRISDSLHDEEVYYLDAAEDDDDDDSDVDVAEDDDNEDFDADATEHNNNYDRNWLFNVQCQPCS